MTTSEKKALRRDMQNPLDLFTLIVENNQEAVSNNMQTWGWTYGSSTKEQLVSKLMDAWNAGGQIRQQALGLVSTVPYRFGVFQPGFDEAITGQPEPPRLKSTEGTAEDQNWYSDINWGEIIGSVFGGVSGVIQSTQGPQPQPAPAPGTVTVQGSGNFDYIVIGVAAIAIAFAVFLAVRK